MAEKKSTKAKPAPKKRTLKKVEESKPENEVQPRKINWDVLFSSAVITFMAAIFFWIGYSYEANWYGFYGISMAQINLPFYQILSQSIPSVLYILLIIAVILGTLLIIRAVINVMMKRDSTIEDLFRSSSITRLIKDNLHYVILLYLLVVFAFVAWVYYTSTKTPYETLSFMEANQTELLLLMLLCLFLILILFERLFLEIVIFFLPEKMKRLIVEGEISRADFNKLHIDPYRNLLIPVLVLISAVYLSAFLGSEDARNGIRSFGGGWKVPMINVVSSSPVIALEEFRLNPTEAYKYVYGPLGYITENEHSIFLIRWKYGNYDYFFRNQGLYTLPRVDMNGAFSIVPAPQSTPTNTSQPTLNPSTTAQPTPIVTMTPALIITAMPTSTQP